MTIQDRDPRCACVGCSQEPKGLCLSQLVTKQAPVEPDPDNSDLCVECGARVFAPNGLCTACRYDTGRDL